MKKPYILVVGSSNTDLIVRVPTIPSPGETVLGSSFQTAQGGKGANQAVAAARAGANVQFVTCLGKDGFGETAYAGFQSEGIQMKHLLRTDQAPTGTAVIHVADNGENCIAVVPGANHYLLPAHIKAIDSTIQQAAMVVVQLEIQLATVLEVITLSAKHKVPVILNPAPAQLLEESMLSRLSYITPNEIEAERLTGIRITSPNNMRRAALMLREKGVPNVVLTVGQQGAFVASEQYEGIVPGFSVNAVDTTAAGDVFSGALACALVEGKPLVQAVRFANAAAAISVTQLGAQPSIPTRNRIEQLLGSFPKV